MSNDDKLTPAEPPRCRDCALIRPTSWAKLRKYQAAETMAKLVAERLVEHLERSGFVIMRKPVPAMGAGDNPGARTPGH